MVRAGAASLSEPLLVRSTGEISVCMYVCRYLCMYVRSFGRLNLDTSIYRLQFLVHFNTRACAVKPTSCKRFSHVGHAAW